MPWRRWQLPAALVGLVCALCGCLLLAQVEGSEARAAESGGEARRIVSLSPSATEMLYAIGAQDRLAGVSRQCDFPVAAKLKPKFGDFNQPDYGALRAARPDAVLFSEYLRPEDAARLEAEGFRFEILPARDVAAVAAALRQLGVLAGRTEAAEQLARRLEEDVRAVRSRVESVGPAARPRVYVEVDGPHRLYAVGQGSFMDDVIRIAGGKNVFAAVGQPYFEVRGEEVVRADPEVIFIDHPFQYKVGVSKREGWSGIAAVRQGRVYDHTDFDIILLNRPGPRIVDSLREISRLLHPGAWHEP